MNDDDYFAEEKFKLDLTDNPDIILNKLGCFEYLKDVAIPLTALCATKFDFDDLDTEPNQDVMMITYHVNWLPSNNSINMMHYSSAYKGNHFKFTIHTATERNEADFFRKATPEEFVDFFTGSE